VNRSPFLFVLATASIATALAACASREHMSDSYGRSSRAIFAKQHVYAQASTGSPGGLDSEESALIQSGYRKSLTGGSGDQQSKDSSSRVLLLTGTPNAGMPQPH